ncbi:protein Jlp2p [[Candida] jaroonii]|uniref:Protein Jlp2p n=1 Tax=[Candida] jaroonii TaxID=467808 RepID=A0ACA9YG59_9ASCO|nr:protein Jlp2p [[Candida] jaroonii]
MVYYFKAKFDDDFDVKEYSIYMGRDKVENDPLIKHSHPKDLWFHVDKVSSAHLYLELSDEQRLKKFQDLIIPSSILDQIGQLTKNNSIKGNKMPNATIIYTTVDNLISDGSMDIGTVTFSNPKLVKRINVGKKDNMIINKLNKTKTEISTDEFINNRQGEKIEFERKKKEHQRMIQNQEKELAKQYQSQRKAKDDPYGELFTEENMHASNNLTISENYEDDFM